MQSSILLILLFFIVPAISQSWNCNVQQQTEILNVVNLWPGKVNYGSQYYLNLTNAYMDDNITFLVGGSDDIPGIGPYHSKNFSQAYSLVLFPNYYGVHNSVQLYITIDPVTIKCFTQPETGNTQCSYEQNGIFYNVWDQNSESWQFIIGDVRGTDTLVFKGCEPIIIIDYATNPREIAELYFITAPKDPNITCPFVQQVCIGGNAQYSSISDCIDYMSSQPYVCPTWFASKDTTCFFIHTLIAAWAPWEAPIHCPHAGKYSHICINSCLPNCSSCASHNASCVVSNPYPTFEFVYNCKCNVGFLDTSGGLGESCLAKTCERNSNCGRFGLCGANGICECMSTFDWDPITGSCECSSDYYITRNDKSFTCIPKGACWVDSDCARFEPDATKVNCSLGYPYPNTLVPYKFCHCNPGFVGGYENECFCYSPNKIVWSSKINGKVCITPGQCASNRDCSSGQTCTFNDSNPIGTCT